MTLLAYSLVLRALCPGRLVLRCYAGRYLATYSIFGGEGGTPSDALTNLLAAATMICRTENAA